ncbi:FecR family protein [Erythrobacter sp. NE805]|uniref:FecR family protein n=1 Tax=Erythrobacter sp. NE805 TaxID=3389875 RepID=UPI00396B1B8B
MNPDQPIRDVAAHWAMRARDPDFDDWEGFTAWLEADPAHAQAYDEVQFALEEADAALELLPAPEYAPAANDNPPGWLTRRGWLGGAIAAALVLALTSVLWLSPGGSTYETAPGETRLIALGDGSTVELAGGSRIALEGTRMARLERGQALFTIEHDAANPFVLTAGDDRLVDAGTVFDVRLAGATLDLAVAEGAVIVNPSGQNLKVTAGGRAVRGSGGRYTLASVDPNAVGEWSRGRISFESASLAEIAAELSRATGRRFSSTDTATRLSGSIAIGQVREDPRALEALLGVRVRSADEDWVLEAE